MYSKTPTRLPYINCTCWVLHSDKGVECQFYCIVTRCRSFLGFISLLQILGLTIPLETHANSAEC